MPTETRSQSAHQAPRDRTGGPEGNERLTALTGAILLVLFAAEGVTILSLRQLLYWHYFIGLLLIGPMCVKTGATIYRFTRYYTRDQAYVRKGPPIPLLRVLGPFVILTTLAVVGTGVALGLDKGSPVIFGFSLLFLHKVSFVLWAGVMTIHVLAYLWRLPRLIAADVHSPRTLRHGHRVAQAVGGRGLRYSLTALGLGTGVILALVGVHLSAAWHR